MKNVDAELADDKISSKKSKKLGKFGKKSVKTTPGAATMPAKNVPDMSKGYMGC